MVLPFILSKIWSLHMVMPLTTEVYQLTSRPDMAQQTQLALKATLRELHMSAKYPRDLFIDDITLAAAGTDTVFGLLAKSVRLVSHLNPATGLAGYVSVPMFQLTTSEIPIAIAQGRTECFWLQGPNLYIRHSGAAPTTAQLVYYPLPDVSDVVAATDWLVTDYASAVMYGAASKVMTRIGNQEAAAGFQQMYVQELQLLQASELGLTIEPPAMGNERQPAPQSQGR